MKNIFKSIVAVIFTATFLLLYACTLDTPDTSHPNILFISIDDLRPELGCYGNDIIKTPNIDRLADQGAVFLNTYSQCAVCAPSRASLMTGLRPDSTRVWHLGDKFRKIHPDIITIPQYFHQFGYYTVSMGKIFHNYMPDSISWDEPDLRPAKYRTKEMVDRDAETFYYDGEIINAQTARRNEIIKKRPNAYAAGWNCGPAVENSVAPDSAFYDGAQTDLAIETIRRLRSKDQPFFFALGYYRPHLPFVVPRRYWDLYDPKKIPLASNPFLPKDAPIWTLNSMYELRGYMGFGHIKHPAFYHLPDDTARMLKRGYYASVSYIDTQVGRLMAELKKLQLNNNTIIVILGDHGWKLGEHNSWGKMTNYEIDTRVPLIIYTPEKLLKNKKITALTELVDIFPTLCDLSGIPPLPYLQGTSMVKLMKNPETKWKKAVFSQFHRRPKVSPDKKRYMGYSMHTDRYHYVEWYFWDNERKMPLDLAGLELYDLSEDPGENINIADKKENKSLLGELSAVLKSGWRKARPK